MKKPTLIISLTPERMIRQLSIETIKFPRKHFIIVTKLDYLLLKDAFKSDVDVTIFQAATPACIETIMKFLKSQKKLKCKIIATYVGGVQTVSKACRNFFRNVVLN